MVSLYLGTSEIECVVMQALIHGLNRHYYSLLINYRKNELEERMLLNLSKKGWAAGLTLEPFESHRKRSAEALAKLKVRNTCQSLLAVKIDAVLISCKQAGFVYHWKLFVYGADELQEYSKKYADEVKEEGELDPKARVVAKVGKLDAKKNIDRTVQSLMSKNILQCMGTMLDSVVF